MTDADDPAADGASNRPAADHPHTHRPAATDHPDADHPNTDHPAGTPTAVFDVPELDAHVAYYADLPADDENRARTAHPPATRTHDGLSGSFVTEQYGEDCTIAVDAHPHQSEIPVSLDLVAPWATLGVGLEPTEARAVAYSLLHVAAECAEG